MAAEDRKAGQVYLHEFIVSHNPVATTELPCNQCMEICPCRPGTAKGTIIYSISYVSKVDGIRDTDPRATMLLALEGLKKHIEGGRNVAPEDRNKKMALSVANKINSVLPLTLPAPSCVNLSLTLSTHSSCLTLGCP